MANFGAKSLSLILNLPSFPEFFPELLQKKNISLKLIKEVFIALILLCN